MNQLKYECPKKWQKLTSENMILTKNDVSEIRNYLFRIIIDISRNHEVSDCFKKNKINSIKILIKEFKELKHCSPDLAIKIKKLLIIFEVIEHNENKFYDLYEGAFSDIMFNEKMMFLFELISLNFEEDRKGEQLTKYKFEGKNVNISIEIQEMLFNRSVKH